MKILLWDLETLPMLIAGWGLYDPPLNHEKIIRESQLACAAWKWLGTKSVHTSQVALPPKTDLNIVKDLHRVLGEADVLVAHNGDKFDLRKFNARALAHHLPPLPPIPTIDTLKVAKRYFGFNSNRLDYLGQFLGVGKKLHTDFKLWLDVMNGDAEALARMVRYNKQDVLLLEKVYLALRPFIRNHPNSNLHSNGEVVCPNCEGRDLVKRGFKYQRTTKRQQFQCGECGAYCCGEYVSRSKVA